MINYSSTQPRQHTTIKVTNQRSNMVEINNEHVFNKLQLQKKHLKDLDSHFKKHSLFNYNDGCHFQLKW